MAKRKHVPGLNELELQAALAKLEQLRISAKGKREIENILKAASNPAAESPEALIAGLSLARQEAIAQGEKALGTNMRKASRRARAALMDMDEDEFQRLVDEANESTP